MNRSKIDLFSTAVFQQEILGCEHRSIDPFSAIGTGPIDFVLKDNKEYLDLSDTLLYLKCKIVNADGTVLKKDADIALINNSMHSLFSDIALLLNGVKVEGGDGMYPFRAYIDTVFSHSADILTQQGFTYGYNRDDATLMDSNTNAGHVTRKTWSELSAVREFMGKLHLDLFKQDRLLIPGVDVIVRLERAKDAFAIMNHAGEAERPKVVITEAKLHIKTVKVATEVFDMHMQAMQNEISAIYPINRVVMETMCAKEKDLSLSKEFLFYGKVPKYLFMAMTNTTSFYGQYTKNPFNFQNFKLKYLNLKKDTVSYPFEPFEPDFKAQQCLREYISLFQSNNILGKNTLLPISFEEFKKGYTHFQFNLSDNCHGVNTHPATGEKGNLKLTLKFAEALTESVIVLLYGVFDNNIYIQGSGAVLTDFND